MIEYMKEAVKRLKGRNVSINDDFIFFVLRHKDGGDRILAFHYIDGDICLRTLKDKQWHIKGKWKASIFKEMLFHGFLKCKPLTP